MTEPPAPPAIRTALREIRWPPLPDRNASNLLAVQYQFEQSQWWPANLLQERQLQQLQRLLAHARRSSPWYRERLPAICADADPPLRLSDLLQIPITTKRALRDHAQQLLSTDIPASHGNIGWVATSGSTGDPARVAGTALNSWLSHAATLRDHFWQQRDFAASLAIIRYPGSNQLLYPDSEERPNWGSATGPVLDTGPAHLLNSSSNIADQARWLIRIQPGYLLTYPSNLQMLCRHFQAHDLHLDSLLQVRTIGEQLSPGLRQLVQETWNVKLVDTYSAFETGYMAFQCPQHDHYHVHAEGVLLEILDDDNQPCQVGEVGRVVATPLQNFAMPLIRYELGDYAEPGPPCSCGRGLPVLKRIMGRTRNMLQCPDGGVTWPVFGTRHFQSIAPIRQFQAIQTSPTNLELRLVSEAPVNRRQERELAQLVKKYLRCELHITFSYHDRLERGAGGKFEEFISLVTSQP